MARLGSAEPQRQAQALPKAAVSGPIDFLPIARITAALGLHGQVRARLLSPAPSSESALLESASAWLHLPRQGWWQWQIDDARPQGQDLRIRFQEISSRDLAEQLLGAEIGLARSALPAVEEDEAYWVDLLGCEVVNASGAPLGEVSRLETNGVQDWLVAGPHWIPYVDRHILSVDLTERRIVVDWEEDWT